ncbi:FkbM family methyltransferase [Luteimonas sp. MC1825]|uniref:FkbM family methyltransferase n=1 Tax=Luteimonas sp. MC1825 TaxID=2761107 RepID=UPI00160F66AA|nr:FkbM family methyltransferase [Luteimonas sp. MC1825]MBB6599044.1 FkbM family methyltransferase [Luteimonas sp. MC1825]QOC89177.1 FkbM family methyltransferase [Luteimonas sp. MC1825]
MKQFLRALRDHPLVLTPLVAVLSLLKRIGFDIAERVYRHAPFRGTVTTAVTGGASFRIVSEGRKIENGLYWRGIDAHEPKSMAIWMEAARNARTVLDVGANSGVFSLAAAAAGAGAIHAFEPLARVHGILSRNFALNPGFPLQAWAVAVSDQSGVAELHDPGGAAPTSASLSAEFSREHLGDVPTCSVPVVTIDDFCARERIHGVDLVKIDVEGLEEHVLRGMRAVALRDRPLILMEVLDGYEAQLRKVAEEVFGGDVTWHRVDEGDGGPNRNVVLDFKATRQ